MDKEILAGNTPLKFDNPGVTGEYLHINGEKFYKISHYNQMPAFFMSLTGADEHWLFISSNGALTAGRRNPDNALFPYYTEDKIHDSANTVGSKTIIFLNKADKNFFWEPFSDTYAGLYRCERNLYKNIPGNVLIFEEINHDLALCFRYSWKTSEKFGFIKEAELLNLSDKNIEISLLDGIRNILPYGIDSNFQNNFSNLADAYKRNELLKDEGLALYYMNSLPTDKAEPAEGLKATTVWSRGLSDVKYLLSERQLNRFRKSQTAEEETDLRAARGAFFMQSDFALESNSFQSWLTAADINQDAAAVVKLRLWLQHGDNPTEQVNENVLYGTQRLLQYTAAADGLQKSRDETGTARHFSNVMFNIMRGGIIYTPKGIPVKSFSDYVKNNNRSLYKKYSKQLSDLPDYVSLNDLQDFAEQIKNPDLIRAAGTYLPLIFSRRHGDPSRPWNYFSVNLKGKDGSLKYYFEGNWRDVFQNWEALAYSFPAYVNNMVSQFLNASTIDGYNPYRISSNGIDWEVLEPDNPWSNIGYWGDHQIVYLHKLLDLSLNFYPQALNQLLTQEVFVYADVPYRIKSYREICHNPFDTIVFDYERDKKIRKQEKKIGQDAKLLLDESGDILRVNMTEKLLLTSLVKLSNFVPDAGIWLNTQRPEWNDANNALTGKAASMVTVYQMRPYLQLLRDLIKSSQMNSFKLSTPLKHLLYEIYRVFEENRQLLNRGFNAKTRKATVDALGLAGDEYRASVYAGLSGNKSDVPAGAISDFINLALKYIDHAIQSSKRFDNLYHSYNLLRFDFDKDELHVDYLYEMLEGQAAVLASGCLSAKESLQLLDALKNSALFRSDQYSYILYPDRDLPGFTQKNNIPDDFIRQSDLVKKLLETGNTDILKKDVSDDWHFNGEIRNVEDLNKRLDDLLKQDGFETLIRQERNLLTNVWERIFKHSEFTGRSGTFFGYEGLGSIYWHMVSKLLQAAGQTYTRALDQQTESEILSRLVEHYYEIRAGIGMNKSPEVYGAFPTDPYSHTPAHAGAKQPGMTGQVKEDIISRFIELGVHINNGRSAFKAGLLRKSEFLNNETDFHYYNFSGDAEKLNLPAGSMAFTFCSVPVVYRLADKEQLEVHFADAQSRRSDELILKSEESRSLFSREGKIIQLDVYIKPQLD